MQSKATTVKDYLAELPPDRRAAIQAVREVILKNLDKGFEEGMQYGAIGYFVPHRLYPAGYHCDPKIALPFGGLGSQKHHMSIGFMHIYGDANELKWFQSAWAKTGKKLDMGKCCIRFKKVDDLPLDLIGEAVGHMTADRYIEFYENARETNWGRSPSKKSTSKKKKTTVAKNPKSKVKSKAKSSKSPAKKAAAKRKA